MISYTLLWIGFVLSSSLAAGAADEGDVKIGAFLNLTALVFLAFIVVRTISYVNGYCG